MEKVYTLPDLPPAPTSDLQLLVRRLLEYADWSVLPALVDELKATGREQDLAAVKQAVRHFACPTLDTSLWDNPFKLFAEKALETFYFDLFSMEGIIQQAVDRSKPASNSKIPYRSLLSLPREYVWQYTASEEIPAGSLVEITSNGTVRRSALSVQAGGDTAVNPQELTENET
jgi:hypothetical protein